MMFEGDLNKVINETLMKSSIEENSETFNVEDEDVFDEPEARKLKQESKRPDISHLVDAVTYLEDGTPVFVPDVGEKVVIERYSSLLKDTPWLDTTVYEVSAIDAETGNVKLWNPDLMQHAQTNYLLHGKSLTIKLYPADGSDPMKKRRSSLIESEEEQKPQPRVPVDSAPGEPGEQKPKRRGRPKGSKNRPKEVIEAEKKLKREQRLAKKSRRKSR